MADALPFVQVNIPQGNIAPGTEAGGRSVNGGEAAEPGFFDSLVAEFSVAQDAGTQASPQQPVPAAGQMEQPQAIQPPLLLSDSVLGLMASMKDGAEEMPLSSLPAVDALMEKMQELVDKGLLSKQSFDKLTSLLSRLRTAKPEDLTPSLRDEALQLMEELSPELEPEAMEDLKQQILDVFPGQPEERAPETEPAPVPAERRAGDVPGEPRRKAPSDDDKEDEVALDAEDISRQDIPASSLPAFAAESRQELRDARRPDGGERDIASGMGREPAPEGMGEGQPAISTPSRTAREAGARQREEQPQEAAEQAAAAQSRPQEAASERPAAPQGAENQEAAPVAPRAVEEQQPNASRDGGGNGGAGAQGGGRGQQTAGGLRRAAGNVPAASDEEGASRAESRESPRGASFQSFFEGVLSSRRTGATPAPMSLTSTPNVAYTQRGEVLRDGLVNVVRFVRADGVQRANVVVDPPALGRISVELTTSTSGVEASIRVSSEQVRQLVQDQLSQLRMTLEQQGVQVTQFTVDVQPDGGERQQGQEQDGQNGDRRRRGRVGAVEEAEEDTAEEFRVDLEEGMLHWVA